MTPSRIVPPLALAALLGLPASPVPAQSPSPPYPPSSYDLRVVETLVREAQAEQAEEQRRRSRQREMAGTGQAQASTDVPPQPSPIRVTTRTLVDASMVGLAAVAAIGALTNEADQAFGFRGGRPLDPASGGSVSSAVIAPTSTSR